MSSVLIHYEKLPFFFCFFFFFWGGGSIKGVTNGSTIYATVSKVMNAVTFIRLHTVVVYQTSCVL